MSQFDSYCSQPLSNANGLFLQGFGALKESGEAQARMDTLEASVLKRLAKISMLKSQKQELLDKNRGLQNHPIVVIVEKKCNDLQMWKVKRPSPTPMLTLLILKYLCHCMRVRYLQIGKLWIALKRVFIECKVDWQ